MRHPNRQVLDQDSIRATPRECTPLHSLRPSQSSTGDDSSDGVALSCGWVGGGRGGSEERRSLGESGRGGASNCGSEGCAAGAHGRSRLRLGARLKMVYHSSAKVDPETQLACSCPLLPLKSHIRGPAPAAEPGSTDIIDEAINFFRANVLFRKFDVKGPADKLLVYLTLYINMALKRIEACKTEADGVKAIINLGLEKFPLPGEPGFPLGGLFTASQTKDEGELFRNYFKQVREETSGRLMERVYRQNGTPNKWWLAFANRKFMNIMMLL